ncbi:MAG: hypothetical protein Q4A45_02900 [Clostridia bacterium]|nr:hypothetical protein [Clostridia bacterium]
MSGFFETLSVTILFMFIVNILGQLFSDSRVYGTYVTVVSIIVIYVLLCPLGRPGEIYNDSDISLENPYYDEGEEYEFASSVYENFELTQDESYD